MLFEFASSVLAVLILLQQADQDLVGSVGKQHIAVGLYDLFAFGPGLRGDKR
jgi:hypothetical protein